MTKKKLFIAYHGTYDNNGSLSKAEEIYTYLKEAGVDCYLFSAINQSNDEAFINTPEIANECEKFLLVCNENIRTDEEGKLLNNGVLQEVRAFWKRIYYNESSDGDARVYGFNSFTSSMANQLHLIFKGVAHFTEIRNNGNDCFAEVLAWVNAKPTDQKKEEVPVSYQEDILFESIRISKKSEYGISPLTYNEKLLPALKYDGGKEIRSIFDLELEKNKTYVICANGGSGKSYSLKSLWMEYLQSDFIPLYISVRKCHELFAQSEHPLYEYLLATYKHFPGKADQLDHIFKKEDASWLLLLDGYNEVDDVSKILADLQEIEEYVTIVLTTRDKSFLSGLDTNSMVSLKLQPLSEHVVREYISSYSGNAQLLSLLSNTNMLVLLRNPMLLTMFCNSFDASNYNFRLDDQSVLTSGELIEKCVTAQLKKTDSVDIKTFFSILSLFSMSLADMYYKNKLNNMTVSRIELSKEMNQLLPELNVDDLEAFYLLEYADRWGIEGRDEELEELVGFLRERKPLEIRNQLNAFERIVSKVLQFFSLDTERSHVGGGLYRFDHQTSLNWYIAYGIYTMADLCPERFSEIIQVIKEEIDVSEENRDDYEEQGEFIFDLVRDYAEDENYRLFASKLFKINFKRRTSRIYAIATNCISLYDKCSVSAEEYVEEVGSFCYSLFSLGKRNTPSNLREEAIVDKYAAKLKMVFQRAEKIRDEEIRMIRIAKLNTIQGALELCRYRLCKARAIEEEKKKEMLQEYLQKAMEDQLSALHIREEILEKGSEKYRNEMRNRISYSYTSLGTISFYQGDYDASVEYQQKAYDLRIALAEDESVEEEIRKDALVTSAINLSRINGSTLRKGNITREVLLELFAREELLSNTEIEEELIAQARNFAQEIEYINRDETCLRRAREVYEKINSAYIRMFGYQSDVLKELESRLENGL